MSQASVAELAAALEELLCDVKPEHVHSLEVLVGMVATVQPGGLARILREMSDGTLALGVQKQFFSLDAFTVLAARYEKKVLGLLVRKQGDVHFAEDLTQEVLIKLWLLLAEGPDTPGQYDPERLFWRWFRVIALNHWRDAVRRGRRLQFLSPEDLAARWEEDDPEKEALHGAINGALASLTPEEQRVLRMQYFDGIKPAEIARRTGMPYGAVTRASFRARRQIERELADQGYAVAGGWRP
jgi:RNA polymerase sigma-70 factor (ECF subfamily)